MKSRPLVFGHRGAAGYAPENTLLSIAKALDLGADGVEVDVRTCAGGELVVFHDEALDRITDGSGLVSETPLETLRSLDAGYGQKIPLVEEVLDLVRGRALLNLEIKDSRAVSPLSATLRRAVASGWNLGNLLVSCFEHEVLREFRHLSFEVPIALLSGLAYAGLVGEALSLGAEAVHLSRDAAGRKVIGEAHSAGLRVRVYTVNDPGEMLALAEMGADGLFTDFPDRAFLGFTAPGAGPPSRDRRP